METRNKGFGNKSYPFAYQDESGNWFKKLTSTDTWIAGTGTVLNVPICYNEGEVDYYSEVSEGSTAVSQTTWKWENCGPVIESCSGYYFDERADVQTTIEYSMPFNWPSEAISNFEECFSTLSFTEGWVFNDYAESYKILTDIPQAIQEYSHGISEYRLSHPPTATGYLKIWLDNYVETYSPDGSVISQSVQPFSTYEWSGKPLFPDQSVNSEANRIISSAFQVPLPESYSVSHKIFMSKWSMLPNYVPSDPVSVNLLGAPFFHERPSPDCFSNAVPNVSPELNGGCQFGS